MRSNVHPPIRNNSSRGYIYNLDRGKQILNFFESKIYLRDKSVLDIGCGSGVLTIPFSKKCKMIYALDNQRDNLEFIKGRCDNTSKNIEYLYNDVNMISLNDKCIDLVLINGVLEWMGIYDPTQLPSQNQVRFLLEVKRVLKDNGIIYIGIENRLFYKYLLNDPHQNMFFVNLFPRWFARSYAKFVYNKDFYAYIYSIFGYRRLMKNVGLNVEIFVPVFNYQYPASIVQCTNDAILSFVKRKELPQGLSEEFEDQVKPVFSKTNILKVFFLAKLGILKYMVPSYSLLCMKG